MDESAGTYTISELARRAGVSARTLRLYEEEGLLSPARNASGYRTYTDADARRLAEICAMRRCGLGLRTIRAVLESDAAGTADLLRRHLVTLGQRRQALEDEMRRTRAAIRTCEEMGHMTTDEAFERLKRDAIDENERTYGKEARARFGDATIDAANAHLAALEEGQWEDLRQLEGAIIEQLRLVRETGDAQGIEAQRLCRLHERWLRLMWPQGTYTSEAHLGLAEGYLADERFCAYYDTRAGEGATDLLVRALRAHLRP